jgi:hypothetical protein
MAYVNVKQLSSWTYQHEVVTELEKVCKEMQEELCRYGRSCTPHPEDVWVLIDCGWSHPGHWANESTVVAIDGRTGLPLMIKNLIRGKNYHGSSKGKNVKN